MYAGISDALVQEPDKVSILGKVHQKLECRPPSDVGYMLMKKEEIRKASQPVRSVQQLDRVVNNYKPVADHKNNVLKNTCIKCVTLLKVPKFHIYF